MKSFSRVYVLHIVLGHNGQRHYWSKSLKVLRCNGYNNTKLQNYNLLNINVIRYYPNWGEYLIYIRKLSNISL